MDKVKVTWKQGKRARMGYIVGHGVDNAGNAAYLVVSWDDGYAYLEYIAIKRLRLETAAPARESAG